MAETFTQQEFINFLRGGSVLEDIAKLARRSGSWHTPGLTTWTSAADRALLPMGIVYGKPEDVATAGRSVSDAIYERRLNRFDPSRTQTVLTIHSDVPGPGVPAEQLSLPTRRELVRFAALPLGAIAGTLVSTGIGTAQMDLLRAREGFNPQRIIEQGVGVMPDAPVSEEQLAVYGINHARVSFDIPARSGAARPSAGIDTLGQLYA